MVVQRAGKPVEEIFELISDEVSDEDLESDDYRVEIIRILS